MLMPKPKFNILDKVLATFRFNYLDKQWKLEIPMHILSIQSKFVSNANKKELKNIQFQYDVCELDIVASPELSPNEEYLFTKIQKSHNVNEEDIRLADNDSKINIEIIS